MIPDMHGNSGKFRKHGDRAKQFGKRLGRNTGRGDSRLSRRKSVDMNERRLTSRINCRSPDIPSERALSDESREHYRLTRPWKFAGLEKDETVWEVGRYVSTHIEWFMESYNMGTVYPDKRHVMESRRQLETSR